jgi:pimeloyl-ACP methyl ester carboxylesterase
MRSELITFHAADNFPLDGLLHAPAGGGATHAALLVHGKVMNFYTGPGRILPPYLTAMGFTCLAMNRRGHDLGGIRNVRESYGGSWEKFSDSQLDIAAGIAALRERGCSSIVLIGHSFGGIAAAAYAGDRPADVAALALCSAGTGGLDYLIQSSRRGMLAADRHEAVDAEARRLVAEGRGDQMIALPGWWYAITAASWVDLSINVPVTLRNVQRYPGPLLALRGSREDAELYPAEAMAAASRRGKLAVIPEADHFYNRAEGAFGQAVCEWLGETRI